MNVFTKLKDKIKDFFTETTSASKLKYAVVAVILLVAVAAVAVVGTAGNEEAPEATLSTESLTIQFDEEIVINFDEETDEDEPSSVEENADVTETDPAEETSAAESEKDTKSESTEAETSESTTDKQSAPSEETDPTADAPEETKAPAAQTPVTEKPQAQVPVTQAPVTQKPATQAPATQAPATQTPVTQAPATQAPVTQAPATQAPATQAPATQAPATQAPVTQAPVTQKPVTQKPAEEPEETKNHGNWVVKQKKYYYDTAPYVICHKGVSGNIYNGPTTPGNVMILNIENKSDEAYTITIKAKYLDSAGNVIGTEDRTFEGFAANWSNYFVFAPGYEFDKFTFDFSAKKYNAETYVQYFKVYEECGVSTHMALDGGNGRESYSVNDEGFDAMKKLIAVDGYVRGGYTGTGIVDYTGTIVLFDKNGDLAYIRRRGNGNVTGSPEVGQGGPGQSLFLTDIPYSEVDSYKIPDNLTSVSGFYAIETFSRK